MTSRSDSPWIFLAFAALAVSCAVDLAVILMAAQTRDVGFSWCPSDGATSYALEWSQQPRTLNGSAVITPGWKGTASTTIYAPWSTVKDIAVADNTRWYFNIRAIDAAGVMSGYSNEVCVALGSAPACNVYLPIPTDCGTVNPRLPMPSIRIRPQ